MHSLLALFATLNFGLRLDVGTEYDSNANRAERLLVPSATAMIPSATAPIDSLLLRTTGAGSLVWSQGPSRLRVDLAAGGKHFFDERATPQDVLVLQPSVEETVRIGSRLALRLGGDYYEAIQWNACPSIRWTGGEIADRSCHRDFRTASGSAGGTLRFGAVEVGLSGGYRGLDWKPDGDLSFGGPLGVASAIARFQTGPVEDPSDWEIGALLRYERRRYIGSAFDARGRPGEPRSDEEVVGRLSLSYVGPLLASASYAIDRNESSSYAQSLLRHIVTLKAALDLPLDLTLSTRAQLVLMSYGEQVTLTSGAAVPLSIEDESRNAIVADLARPLGRRVLLNARYSVYRGGTGGVPVDYLRQVVYLGASLRID